MNSRIPVLLFSLVLTASGCNAVRYGLPALVRGPVHEEVVLEVAAFDLAPRSDHHDLAQPPPLFTTFPEDGWVHGFQVEVLDAQGDTVPLGVVHHVQVLMPERREAFTPVAWRLMGAGSETRAAELPSTLGVPMRMGDSLLVNAMVHNPTDELFEGVRIRVRLTYTAVGSIGNGEGGRRGITNAAGFFLHVTPPQGPADFDLPPGLSSRSWEARPVVGGRILMLGGHLHRHAVSLRFEDVTTGRTIWRARPVTDAQGNILEVPRRAYRLTRGPRLRTDRVYRVTVTYYNPTGTTIVDGGMGTVAGVLLPDSPWPPADRTDPVYLEELRSKLEQGQGDGHGAHGHHRRGEAHGQIPTRRPPRPEVPD